jgi:hypothetical protein
MQPNLAKLSCEWLSLWLHHKIIKGNAGEKRRSTKFFWMEEILGETHGILLYYCSGLINKCILGSLMMSTYIKTCSLEGGEPFQCKEQLLKVC